jgi:glycosyltransferase involved in cell wall biosynthesis
MRVLFVLPHLLTDGPSRQWSIVIPGLVATGHEAAVVTLDAEGRFFADLQANGVPTRCAAMRRRTDLRRLGRAIRAVSPGVPQIVVSHGPGPQLYAQVLSWRWRVPHVTVEHRPPELALRRDQEAIVKMVAPHTQCVIAVTRKQVPRLLRRGYKRQRIRVIPNAVPSSFQPARSRAAVRAELGLGDDDFVALLVSMLSPRKRADSFVAEVIRANRIDPRIRGVVVGSGPDLDLIRGLAREREGVLRVLGERSDIPDLIQAADAVCQSSLAEGLPTVLLEGMACGRPIVATAVGGTEEVVIHGETGFLVPARGDCELAPHLLTLAADPALRGALGEAGRARQREHFSEERMREGYELALVEVREEFERTRGRFHAAWVRERSCSH